MNTSGYMEVASSRLLTTIERRHEAYRIYPDISIPQICTDFRQSLNGSGYPWSEEENAATINLLLECLETWHPTEDPFDDLVYQMILETLRYAKHETKDGSAWHPDDDWIENQETEVKTK